MIQSTENDYPLPMFRSTLLNFMVDPIGMLSSSRSSIAAQKATVPTMKT